MLESVNNEDDQNSSTVPNTAKVKMIRSKGIPESNDDILSKMGISDDLMSHFECCCASNWLNDGGDDNCRDDNSKNTNKIPDDDEDGEQTSNGDDSCVNSGVPSNRDISNPLFSLQTYMNYYSNGPNLERFNEYKDDAFDLVHDYFGCVEAEWEEERIVNNNDILNKGEIIASTTTGHPNNMTHNLIDRDLSIDHDDDVEEHTGENEQKKKIEGILSLPCGRVDSKNDDMDTENDPTTAKEQEGGEQTKKFEGILSLPCGHLDSKDDMDTESDPRIAKEVVKEVGEQTKKSEGILSLPGDHLDRKDGTDTECAPSIAKEEMNEGSEQPLEEIVSFSCGRLDSKDDMDTGNKPSRAKEEVKEEGEQKVEEPLEEILSLPCGHLDSKDDTDTDGPSVVKEEAKEGGEHRVGEVLSPPRGHLDSTGEMDAGNPSTAEEAVKEGVKKIKKEPGEGFLSLKCGHLDSKDDMDLEKNPSIEENSPNVEKDVEKDEEKEGGKQRKKVPLEGFLSFTCGHLDIEDDMDMEINLSVVKDDENGEKDGMGGGKQRKQIPVEGFLSLRCGNLDIEDDMDMKFSLSVVGNNPDVEEAEEKEEKEEGKQRMNEPVGGFLSLPCGRLDITDDMETENDPSIAEEIVSIMDGHVDDMEIDNDMRNEPSIAKQEKIGDMEDMKNIEGSATQMNDPNNEIDNAKVTNNTSVAKEEEMVENEAKTLAPQTNDHDNEISNEKAVNGDGYDEKRMNKERAEKVGLTNDEDSAGMESVNKILSMRDINDKDDPKIHNTRRNSKGIKLVEDDDERKESQLAATKPGVRKLSTEIAQQKVQKGERKQKKVSFSRMSSREFERIPDVTMYMGLSLGWNYVDNPPKALVGDKDDDHELSDSQRSNSSAVSGGGGESKAKRKLPNERFTIFLQYGYNPKELRQITTKACKNIEIEAQNRKRPKEGKQQKQGGGGGGISAIKKRFFKGYGSGKAKSKFQNGLGKAKTTFYPPSSDTDSSDSDARAVLSRTKLRHRSHMWQPNTKGGHQMRVFKDMQLRNSNKQSNE